MKVLFDECLPRKLKGALPDHACDTAPDAGFAGQQNGRLLTSAENAGFQVFITMDKSLKYQQNLSGRNIAIVVLRAKSNRLPDLLPLMEPCRLIMDSIQPGQVVFLP